MNNAHKEIFVKTFKIEPTKVVFIDDAVDPLYAFWKMVHKDSLPEDCLVVMDSLPHGVNIDDVRPYGVVRLGQGIAFQYSKLTSIGVKPSQRGLFYRR